MSPLEGRPRWRCAACEFSPLQDAANFRSAWAKCCRTCEKAREMYRREPPKPPVTPSTYRRRINMVAKNPSSMFGHYPEEERAAILRARDEWKLKVREAGAAAAERASTDCTLPF